MEYRQIVAITGLPGLFQLINAQNNGAIVKNLSDNKGAGFISSRKHQLTPLESIEIYTTGENLRLTEVFTKIKDFDEQALEANAKNDKAHYRELFQTILPDYDEERVYANDIKKVFQWYQILKENDLLNFEEDDATEEEESEQTTTEATPEKE